MVAHAVSAWKQHRFEDFGEKMGIAIREVMVRTFPEKWSFNEELGAWFRRESSMQRSATWPIFAASMVCLPLLAFVTVRIWRITKPASHSLPEVEALGSDGDHLLVLVWRAGTVDHLV